MVKEICFDMDGTIVDLYGVENWLNRLISHDPTPYEMAKPLVNMSALARLIHKVQKLGYSVKIISWLADGSNAEYDRLVTAAKIEWLRKHLPSVEFNEIIIAEYGTPKSTLGNGILFEDNAKIRNEWKGLAYEPTDIFNILRGIEVI